MLQRFRSSTIKLVMPLKQSSPNTTSGVPSCWLNENMAITAFTFQFRYQQAVESYSTRETEAVHPMLPTDTFSKGENDLFEMALKTVCQIPAITVGRKYGLQKSSQFFNRLRPRRRLHAIVESLIPAT